MVGRDMGESGTQGWKGAPVFGWHRLKLEIGLARDNIVARSDKDEVESIVSNCSCFFKGRVRACKAPKARPMRCYRVGGGARVELRRGGQANDHIARF